MNDNKAREYWDNQYWRYVIEKNKFKNVDRSLAKDYFDCLKTVPNKIALDVGCGLGSDTKFLLEQGFTVTSTDFSETALGKMKELVPSATVLRHDTSKPFPFKDETFGVITANLSLHYFDWLTTKKVFRELYRLLAPSGILIGRVNSNKSDWYEKPDTEVAEEIEPDFFWDGQKYRRFFSKEQFSELTSTWKVEVLKEDIIYRLSGNKKAIWDFVFRKEDNK